MAFNRDKALKAADKLLAKGKHKEALAQYQEVVKHDPSDLGSLNKIGDLHLRAGDKPAAVDCFAKIAEKYADDGFNLRAIAMYKKCTRTDPSRVDFHERLADLNAQQGLVNEAKVSYQLVADHHLQAGRHERARELLAKIAELEPDNLKVRLKLADLYLKDNQVNLALGEYLVIGTELAKKGMLDEALQVLDKALGLDPSNIEILRAMARVHAERGQASEAIKFIQAKLQERGGQDPDLLTVLGEAHQAAGDHAGARQSLEQALAGAPDRIDVRQALYRLALDQKDADAALGHVSAVSQQLIADGKGEQVVENLRAILKASDGHVPTLERLLEVQVELGADEKVQADGLSRLSEAYIAQGRYPEAETVLSKLVAIEPEVSQHQEKLDFVKAKQAGGAEAEEAPAPAAAETSFGDLAESSDESGFSMSFDEGELDAEGGGDDRAEFVSEHVAEADVFVKYGLVDKAVDQLQEVLARYPDELPVRQKLKGLHVEEGKKAEAVEQCLAIASALRERGDPAGEQEALAEAREIDPNHPALAGTAPAAPAAEEATAGEFALSFDEPADEAAGAEPEAAAGGEFELSLDAEPPEPAAAAEAAASAGGFEISLDPDEGEEEVAVSVEADEEPELDVSLDAGDEEELEVAVEEEGDEEFDVSVEDDEELAVSVDDDEDEVPLSIDEADDEVALSIDADDGAPIALGGGDAAPAELEPPLEPEPAAAEEPAAEVAVAVEEPVAAEAEEGLFGEEDDFFNLADELNRELEAESTEMTQVSRGQDDEMSLEQIVEGIQAGVAQQVEKEDYETHYNLGIAYKEMGLVDEAIGEFQYASKDPTRLLQCCILLGACFTEKGMPELAIKWYEKGRQAPDVTEDDELALRYEIAVCREAAGDDQAALREFTEIYGMNARYRDVAQRVSTLKQKLGG